VCPRNAHFFSAGQQQPVWRLVRSRASTVSATNMSSWTRLLASGCAHVDGDATLSLTREVCSERNACSTRSSVITFRRIRGSRRRISRRPCPVVFDRTTVRLHDEAQYFLADIPSLLHPNNSLACIYTYHLTITHSFTHLHTHTHTLSLSLIFTNPRRQETLSKARRQAPHERAHEKALYCPPRRVQGRVSSPVRAHLYARCSAPARASAAASLCRVRVCVMRAQTTHALLMLLRQIPVPSCVRQVRHTILQQRLSRHAQRNQMSQVDRLSAPPCKNTNKHETHSSMRIHAHARDNRPQST
jgi:hypothetical protein